MLEKAEAAKRLNEMPSTIRAANGRPDFDVDEAPKLVRLALSKRESILLRLDTGVKLLEKLSLRLGRRKQRELNNEFEALIVDLARFRDELLAIEGSVALVALLSKLDENRGQSRYEVILENNASGIYQHCLDDLGFSFVVRKFYESYHSHLHNTPLLDDPTALVDFSVFVAIIADEFPKALPEAIRGDGASELRKQQIELATRLVHAVLPQALATGRALRAMADTLKKRHATGGRAILLELPVGNSLPTKLLADMLARDATRHEVVRIALSRNNKQALGITRRELLSNKLEEIAPDSEDTVVLVDEWLTGSNFRNICDLLAKLESVKKATLMPVGLLTVGSSGEDRFQSDVRQHDKIAAKAGFQGDDLRFTIPPLTTYWERDGYFFWSENDRLSGYRKLQTFGAYLSAVEGMMDKVYHDSKTKGLSRAAIAAQIATSKKA